MLRPLPFLLGLVALAATACTPASQPASKIHWADGDSGTIDGQRFRLADVDAPESGPVGSETGAQCEAERQHAKHARNFMQGLTRGAELKVRIYETDRYGRIVVGLDAGDANVGEAGKAAGHLKAWPHSNGRPLGPKPNWCR